MAKLRDFWKRKGDALLTLILFGLSLVLYLRTLAPSVAAIFDDSLEFQLVCYELGIAHPTGYPLYTLLGKLFTFIPLGDVAYGVNLMSAFFAAVTVALLYLVARRIARRPPAVLAALSLAFSPVFWSQAIIAEVYTLNSAFVALLLYLMLKWEAGGKRQAASASPQPAPCFLLAAFLYGLSLTHHRSMILLAPAMALFVWSVERRAFRDLRLIAKLALLFLVPLLLYLYIPIRGLSTTSLDGTYRNTLAGFINQVTASSYGAFITENPLDQARPPSFYLDLFRAQFGWMGLGLGLVGAMASLSRRSKAFALLGMAFAAYVTFGLVYRVADIQVFFIPAFLIYTLWIGIGLDSLWAILTSKRLRAPRFFAASHYLLPALLCPLVALAFIQPLFILKDNYHAIDLSQRWAVHDYGEDMLSQIPQGATVIGILGEMTLLRYFQRTEGLRPDVITIAADREEERLAAVDEALKGGGGVYLTRPLPGAAERYPLSALGPLIEVQGPSVAPCPSRPLAIDLIEGLRLLGYDVALMAPHWQTVVRLTLYWEVLAPLGADYKISTRLYDEEGHLVGQADAVPVHNAYPTAAWRPGETLADVYDLPVLPGTPPGRHHLLVILYEPETGAEVARVELGAIDFPSALSEPPRDSLSVQWAERVDFSAQLQLVGYDFPSETAVFKPGQSVPLILLWQARTALSDDLKLALWLQDEGGKIIGEMEGPLHNRYLPSRWRRGQVVRVWSDFSIPADAADGPYAIQLQVRQGERPLTARRWLLPLGQAFEMGIIRVKGRERLFTVPAIKHPLNIRLGKEVKLLGYELEPMATRAGETLHLTLYWQALSQMSTSYTVFTHLLGDGGHIWGQRDSLPGGGAWPTTGWVSGEVIIDAYDIPIDSDAPPGRYSIEVGLYNAATGERLPTFTEGGESLGDRVLLESIEVRGE